MFTDDIGEYQKHSNRPRLTGDITGYRPRFHKLPNCSDDIEPCRRQSQTVGSAILKFLVRKLWRKNA